MNYKLSCRVFLIVFLLFTLSPVVFAEYIIQIPEGYSLHVKADYRLYLGTEDYIQSDGSDINITAWHRNNWVNYTCNGGIQYIYNGSKPSKVYFDGVLQTEGVGWGYSAQSVISIPPQGTDIAILWGSFEHTVIVTEIITITDDETVTVTIEEVMPTISDFGPGVNSLLQYIFNGDFLGFLQALYVSAFSNVDLLYGVLIMLFMTPLYIRTRSLLLMAILWTLIGSLLIVAMPMVSGLAIFLMIMGVGSLLFKLYTQIRS